MIAIEIFTFNALQENTYVLYDETKECIIIDAGCYDKDEQNELKAFISENNLKPVMLVNTHSHVDHVLGVKFLKDLYHLKFYIHKIDEETLRSVKLYSRLYGFPNYQEPEANGFIAEGEKIKFGNSELDIFFTPGHAPGHVVFVNKEQKICIAGDVLFKGSVGRSDLPGGNHETLIKSIHEKLFVLPDDTIVFPGHGPETTIGREKKTNPYCAIH